MIITNNVLLSLHCLIQKKIIELHLSEKEAKRNEQIANALLQKTKVCLNPLNYYVL